MTVSYDYASGDRLEERNTYTYTPYGGRAFLEAWRRSREEAVAELPPPAERPAPRSGQGGGGGGTDALLEGLLAALSNPGAERARAALEPLLQRFEVTKRVHARYTAAWRPEDPADYRDLGRYVRFAEVLEEAFARQGDLRHLSALLKCVDTLVALRAGLDEGCAARLARLIRSEGSHVTRLEEAS